MDVSLSSIKKPKLPVQESQLSNPTILKYSRCRSHTQVRKNQRSFSSSAYQTPCKRLESDQKNLNTNITLKYGDDDRIVQNSVQATQEMPAYKYQSDFRFKQKQSSINKFGFLRTKATRKKVPINILAQQEAIRQNILEFSAYLAVSES